MMRPHRLIDGNPLPQAPKTTLNFSLKYSQPMGNGAELYAYTDWVYRSKVNFFLYEATEFTGKALTEGGLRVGYEALARFTDASGTAHEVAADHVIVAKGAEGDVTVAVAAVPEPVKYGILSAAEVSPASAASSAS